MSVNTLHGPNVKKKKKSKIIQQLNRYKSLSFLCRWHCLFLFVVTHQNGLNKQLFGVSNRRKSLKLFQTRIYFIDIC